uniref:Uncharacterized protein n=1 Tax=Steinernema glaseri TaxID=37863 RepID=A0A1I8ALM8_9BILA
MQTLSTREWFLVLVNDYNSRTCQPLFVAGAFAMFSVIYTIILIFCYAIVSLASYISWSEPLADLPGSLPSAFLKPVDEAQTLKP